jgi:hypothetical protein
LARRGQQHQTSQDGQSGQPEAQPVVVLFEPSVSPFEFGDAFG